MSDIEARIRTIISERLGVPEDKVKNESSLVEDLGADSLNGVELIMALGCIAVPPVPHEPDCDCVACDGVG